MSRFYSSLFAGGRRVRVAPGVRLFVEDAGEGPAVVLVHGWSLNRHVWWRQISELSAAGHRVLALDLRGHGSSDVPTDGYEIDRLAADLVAVLDACELDDAVLVGWSLGGLVTFRVAALHPARVRGLVLVCSNGVAHSRQPGFPFGIGPEEVLPALVAAERRDRAAMRRKVLADGFAAPPAPEVLDWLLTLSLQTGSEPAVACLETLLGTDQSELAGAVTVPVVQVIGTGDPSVSSAGAAWLCETLADARHVALEECGHYPMIERPDAFQRLLLEATSAWSELTAHAP